MMKTDRIGRKKMLLPFSGVRGTRNRTLDLNYNYNEKYCIIWGF